MILLSNIEVNTVFNVIMIQNRKYKIECRATRTPDKIRCRRGVSILCWPVTSHRVPLVELKYKGLSVAKATVNDNSGCEEVLVMEIWWIRMEIGLQASALSMMIWLLVTPCTHINRYTTQLGFNRTAALKGLQTRNPTVSKRCQGEAMTWRRVGPTAEGRFSNWH
jgi:hypothetical protein